MSNQPTIMVDTFLRAGQARLDQEGTQDSNNYKGLQIYALEGLHQFVGEQATTFLTPGATVLDLAAGSGALSQRLLDLGFRVSATDYVRSGFGIDSVPFIQADLNQPFASLHPVSYDGIIACEIIEHLENPRHFARECFQLLAPGGRMLVTTPNIDSPASKATFLRFGRFVWFEDAQYQAYGHITPLTQWQIHKVFAEAGYAFLWEGSFGNAIRHTEGSPRLRLVARAIGWASKQDPRLAGEIYVAAFEKPRS